MLHTLRFFSLQNAVYFIMLPFLVPVLFAFYLQGVLKFKCKIPAAKGLKDRHSYYVILTAVPLQQWLHERVSLLRYSALHVVFIKQCSLLY